MTEEIAEGFNRIKELVGKLLDAEKSVGKVNSEENEQFVKGLLKKLSDSTANLAKKDNIVYEESKDDCDEEVDILSDEEVEEMFSGLSSAKYEDISSTTNSKPPSNNNLGIQDPQCVSRVSSSCAPSSPSANVASPDSVGGASKKSRYEEIRDDIIAERNKELKASGFFKELEALRSEMIPKKPAARKRRMKKADNISLRRSERLFLSSPDDIKKDVKDEDKAAAVASIIDGVLNSVCKEKSLSGKSAHQLSCKKCGEMFGKRRNLICHIRRVHVGEEKGRDLSASRGELKLSKTSPSVFSCKKCGKEFTKRNSFLTHLRNVDCKRRLNAKKFCDQCEFTATTERKLSKHKFTVHKISSPMFVCDICGSEISNMRRHLLMVHGCRIKSSNDGKSYKCSQCDLVLGKVEDFKRHSLENHQGKLAKVFSCDQCDFNTSYLPNLKRHKGKAHIEDIGFKCDHCSFSTRFCQDLLRHRDLLHSINTVGPSCESDLESIQIFTDDSEDEDDVQLLG